MQLTESLESKDYFESRIQLTKILNFASASEKQVVKKKEKETSITMQRNLFGRI